MSLELTALDGHLRTLSERSNEIAAINVRLTAQALEMNKGLGAELLRLEEERDAAEAAALAIAASHPEWFPEGRKTLKLPHGSVQSRSGTHLEPVLSVADAISRIERSGDPEHAKCLRSHVEPDLEVLERFDDTTLLSLGYKRVTADKLTASPAKAPVAAMKKAATPTAKAA